MSGCSTRQQVALCPVELTDLRKVSRLSSAYNAETVWPHNGQP